MIRKVKCYLSDRLKPYLMSSSGNYQNRADFRQPFWKWAKPQDKLTSETVFFRRFVISTKNGQK